ncbi:MAG: extracellular solute-binding protein [Fervidobacterium sp.]
MRRWLLVIMLFAMFVTSLLAKVTLTVSIWSWDVERYKKLAAEFTKIYPDIEVTFVVNEPDVNGFLTARVAAKQPLPDIVAQSWEGLSYPVSQGWVYPLDDFLKNDKEWTSVPKNLRESFVYNNKTYAVPERLHFQGIYLNLDLLKKLNLPKPVYQWNVELFKQYLRRATTKTSIPV